MSQRVVSKMLLVARQPEPRRPIGETLKLHRGRAVMVKFAAILVIAAGGFFPASVAAQYKPEFKMSVVVNSGTSWGRAALRVAQPATRRMRARTPLVLVACIRLRRGA